MPSIRLGIGIDRTQPSGASYTPLAVDYFARVLTNFSETISDADKANWNTYILARISMGVNSHADLFAHHAASVCTSANQSRTSLFGNYVATPIGMTNGAWSNGVGWTLNGSSYLSWNYNPFTLSATTGKYKLNDSGVYQILNFLNPTVEYVTCNYGGSYGLAKDTSHYYYGMNEWNSSVTYSPSVLTNYQNKGLASSSTYRINGTLSGTLGAPISVGNGNLLEGCYVSGTFPGSTGSTLKGICFGDSNLDDATIFA